MMTRKNHFAGILAVVTALVMIGSAVAFAGAESNKGVLSSDEINAIVNTTTDPGKVSSPFTEVANSVTSSVLTVRNYQKVSSRSNYYGYNFGYGYGYGNSGGDEATERLTSFGSGVVVSNYGHILTNYHVAEDASRLTVAIAGDEKEYEATVVASDEDLDIAVLHVNDLPLTAVQLGDSDQIQVGEWAVVIGTPLSEFFANTVTVGVVSALNREVSQTTYDRYGRKTNITNSMIQVDAAINAGNSGGGMFNTLGQLMGIPARKYSGVTSNNSSIDNIGMCIPINVAKPLIQEALENYMGNTDTKTAESSGSSTGNSDNRPKLGVTVTSLTMNNGSVIPQGAIVTKVEKDSNAEKAGIQVGDVVVEIDGVIISNSNELVEQVKTYEEGSTLQLKVYRAPGMKELFENLTTGGTIDLSGVGEGEYIDLTATMLMNAAL